MRSRFVYDKICGSQDNLYSKLNNFSSSHKTLGRLCSLPVSVLDVAMHTVVSPLQTIERVAMVAINLIGTVFFKNCTIKDAIANIEWALGSAATAPVAIAMAPIKIGFQFFAILIDPVNVQSIHFSKSTYKEVW